MLTLRELHDRLVLAQRIELARIYQLQRARLFDEARVAMDLFDRHFAEPSKRGSSKIDANFSPPRDGDGGGSHGDSADIDHV